MFPYRADREGRRSPGARAPSRHNARMENDDSLDARPEIFWGEIAPCEHLLQIYDEDSVFLDALEGFAAGGFQSGEAVILIATPTHLEALERRLLARGFDIEAARQRDEYIALDAQATLSRFMMDGWPDDHQFRHVVSGLLKRARHSGKRVRAFGEMVALLWAQGYCGATVRLEFLWQNFCRHEGFSLFCAYPKSGFTGDARESVNAICAAHSRVLPG
jgi:hypothetical protein